MYDSFFGASPSCTIARSERLPSTILMSRVSRDFILISLISRRGFGRRKSRSSFRAAELGRQLVHRDVVPNPLVDDVGQVDREVVVRALGDHAVLEDVLARRPAEGTEELGLDLEVDRLEEFLGRDQVVLDQIDPEALLFAQRLLVGGRQDVGGEDAPGDQEVVQTQARHEPRRDEHQPPGLELDLDLAFAAGQGQLAGLLGLGEKMEDLRDEDLRQIAAKNPFRLRHGIAILPAFPPESRAGAYRTARPPRTPGGSA